ncbi:hypothetical protein [Arthrobacter sp. 2MCAF14]|uniref:hypothetical protein n=1 Tax=Arthrobacter sp. 2MCAF14 TaxID=3232982 RepID=UPI003F8EFE8F
MINATGTRIATALGFVTAAYAESGKDFEALYDAAFAEQTRYGIGTDLGGAVQSWLDAHADQAEKISDALETLGIPAGGPNEVGLYSIGDVDIALADEVRGIFSMERIEADVEAAVRTVVEDQAWEAEMQLVIREEALQDSREAQERDDMVLGNDW